MSYKILIVDDSKLARMSVNKALNSLHPDWTRLEAGSADEAVKLMQQAPQFALLDFNMPGRDGLDLAAELRRSSPALRVAVVSANHQQNIVDRARAMGATFLPKPLTEDALGKFLQAALAEIETRE